MEYSVQDYFTLNLICDLLPSQLLLTYNSTLKLWVSEGGKKKWFNEGCTDYILGCKTKYEHLYASLFSM